MFGSRFEKNSRLCGAIATIIAACASGLGCETSEVSVPNLSLSPEQPQYNVSWLSADTLAEISSDSRLVVRLRDAKDLIVVDPTRGPIDFARVDLSCPTAQMALSPWLQGLADDNGVSLENVVSDRFVIGMNQDSVTAILNAQGMANLSTVVPQGTNSVCCEYTCYEKWVTNANGTLSDAVLCNKCILWAPSGGYCP